MRLQLPDKFFTCEKGLPRSVFLRRGSPFRAYYAPARRLHAAHAALRQRAAVRYRRKICWYTAALFRCSPTCSPVTPPNKVFGCPRHIGSPAASARVYKRQSRPCSCVGGFRDSGHPHGSLLQPLDLRSSSRCVARAAAPPPISASASRRGLPTGSGAVPPPKDGGPPSPPLRPAGRRLHRPNGRGGVSPHPIYICVPNLLQLYKAVNLLNFAPYYGS